MNPSECVVSVVSGVNEKREATSRSLASHYERSSEWLTEAIQTCKRKILEGTGYETAEPKRMKKSAEKENVPASNVASAIKFEKKEKQAAPASIKKSKPATQSHQSEDLCIMSLKVVELRNELRQRDLDTTGLKKDLQERLFKAVEEEANRTKESKNVVKSEVKATKPVVVLSTKDGDGDVQMKGAEPSGSRRDSSKMDIVESDASAVKQATAKKQKTVKEKTVAKSFLKSTAEMFSPTKISAKMHAAKKGDKAVEPLSVAPVVAAVPEKESNHQLSTTKTGRSSLTDGLKKTASAIFSASPVRKHTNTTTKKSPYPKESSKTANEAVQPPEVIVNQKTSSETNSLQQIKTSNDSSESKNPSLTAAPVAAIPNKLGSIDKNAGAATKAKRNKCTADRMARLAEIRGKSKPIASASVPGVSKELPALPASAKLKLGSAKSKDSKHDRKLLLTAQMREKAAAGLKSHVPTTLPSSSKLIASQQQKSESVKAPTSVMKATVAPAVVPTVSAPKIASSPLKAHQLKQVAPTSSTKSVKASSSKKKAAPRPDVLSPMSTYEMSDRDQSDTDDSEAESYHHRQKKKVPKWAQKHNLLPALERQYTDSRLDPETIFPPVSTCNLEDIFDQTRVRFKQRTSSANWSKDGVTVKEIVAYKRTMGY